MEFKDHFSSHAADYAKYRPSYPASLFAYLFSISRHRDRAWDCGTGNGQAAVELLRGFREVIATDPSREQIAQALEPDRVTYRVAPAERSDLPDNSVDLITVAQAFHWFDFETFYKEVKRVAKKSANIAIFGYGLNTIDAKLDPVIADFYSKEIGKFWPPERKYLDEGYRTIPFPFREIPAPPFKMATRWNLSEFLGYLMTWSAVQRAIKDTGKNPLEANFDRFRTAWGPAEKKKTITWPLFVRIGQVSDPG